MMKVTNLDAIGTVNPPPQIFQNGDLTITATVPMTFSLNQSGDWEGSTISLTFSNSGNYPLVITSITLQVSKTEPNNGANFRTRWKETIVDTITFAPTDGVTVEAKSSVVRNVGTWQWLATSGTGGTAQGFLAATQASYTMTVTASNVHGPGPQKGPNVII